MAMKPTEKIWHNGKLIRWEDATIHVLSHVVSYGSAVFERSRRACARQQDDFVLHPADRSARVWRYRRRRPRCANRSVPGVLGMGTLSRPGSNRKRRGCLREFLEPHGAQYPAEHGQ